MPLSDVITLEHMDVGRCDAQGTAQSCLEMSARRARKKLFCWKNEECEAGDMKKVSNELPMSISEVTHRIGI